MIRKTLAVLMMISILCGCKTENNTPSNNTKNYKVSTIETTNSEDTILNSNYKEDTLHTTELNSLSNNDNPQRKSILPANSDLVGEKKPKVYPKAQISFDHDTHHFGELMEGEMINHKFIFKNTGTAPLSIKNVDVTCGCTAPSYPFIAIQPGEEGFIGVQYNSVGKSGYQKAKISVFTDGKPSKVDLYLEGQVNDDK